jgi:CRISPR/Cas system-associated endoribonuclease Cas2
MPQPSDAEPRPLTDFASILATKEPVLLVGGQAVNLWAIYYESRTAELAPFVSRDVEVLGDRDTLTALAKVAGTKPQFFPLRPPTNEVGVVIAKDPNGLPLLIEVLRYVHGIDNEDLRAPVYTVAVGETRVQVPGPIALLQAKLANVADFAQAGRQDGRHVAILFRLLPAYLDDLQKTVIEGRMEEGKFLEFLERLLAIVSEKKSAKIITDMQLDSRVLFAELGDKRLSKLNSFLRKRLPRTML